MSGNTPVELIERESTDAEKLASRIYEATTGRKASVSNAECVTSADIVADLQVHAWDDCGGQPPDTHIAIQAADQLTVLTARVTELEAAVQYFSYHAQLEDSLADARAGDQG